MKSIKIIGRKLVKNVQAVSPIIATLMLVLVAVGSAGAFYMWQTGWQSDVEGKAGGADIKSTLSIGGSSTVYEFTVIAKEIFEAQNPNYKIDVQKGGSGSGITAAGMGLVDIGAASKDASGDFTKYPDLNRDGEKDLGVEMVQTTIAYDGVVVVVSASNGHGLTSINRGVLDAIYEAEYLGSPLAWNVIPAAYTGTIAVPGTTCTGTGNAETYDRAEESGTEECFCEKLMGGVLSDAKKQMASGYTTHSLVSNQELIADLADNPDGIGFTAWGLAASNSDLVIIPFSADGSTLATGDGLPSATEIKDGSWPGSRPLNLLTVGKPSGDAKVFVDFCLMTEMNQLICGMSDYVSIYV